MAQMMDIDKRAVDEFITAIINTAKATAKKHIDEIVEDVIENLLLVVCCNDEALPDEYVPSTEMAVNSIKSTIEQGPASDVFVDRPKLRVHEMVNLDDKVSVKGTESRTLLGDSVCCLDPDVSVPQLPASRRQIFATAWKSIKRVLLRMCCIRSD